MKPLDRLIECAYEGCGQYCTNEDLEQHLKLKHNTNLKEYKKMFPNARTEVLEMKVEALVDQVVKREKRQVQDDIEELPKIDLTGIKDPDFIVASLKAKFPEKHAYFQKTREEYLNTGMPPGQALDTLAFMHLMLRDAIMGIMESPDKKGRFVTTKEEIEILKRFAETFETQLKSFKSLFEQRQQQESIDKKLENLMTEAETQVRQSLGELAFKCAHCGAMIDTSGFNHWAFEILQEASGKKIYLLWNSALWELIKGFRVKDIYDKEYHWQIPIWMMAFVLETSIEGLMFTAKHRNMQVERFEKEGRKWAKIDGFEFDIGFQEEQSRLALDFFKREYHKKSVRNL